MVKLDFNDDINGMSVDDFFKEEYSTIPEYQMINLKNCSNDELLQELHYCYWSLLNGRDDKYICQLKKFIEVECIMSKMQFVCE
jgi:hypothetical protein